jgi:hypothetical protein
MVRVKLSFLNAISYGGITKLRIGHEVLAGGCGTVPRQQVLEWGMYRRLVSAYQVPLYAWSRRQQTGPMLALRRTQVNIRTTRMEALNAAADRSGGRHTTMQVIIEERTCSRQRSPPSGFIRLD